MYRYYKRAWLLLHLMVVGCHTPNTAVSEPCPPPQTIQTPMAFVPPSFAKRRPAPAIPAPHKPHRPLCSQVTVIIDPGHGGDDEGAKSLGTPVYCEKNFNLVAARFLREHLDQMGISTQMTRDKDVFVSLERRAQFATRRSKEIFVSVHFNAAPSADAEGIEVFYYNDKDHSERTAASKALASAVFAQVVPATKAKPRGVKHGNYHVLRENTVPAILIEGGFLTHSTELESIKDPVYLKQLTRGVAQGIANYLKSSK